MKHASFFTTFCLRSLVAASFWLALTHGPHAEAKDEAPPASVDVTHHAVSARFDLAGHRLIARDTIQLAATTSKADVAFRLAPSLTIREIQVDGSVIPMPERGDKGQFNVAIPMGAKQIAMAYDGVIFDAVKKEADLAWVVGDDTTGVISEKGVYLSGASQWIPRLVGARAPTKFSIETWVPAPFLVVTQGDVPTRRTVIGMDMDAENRTIAPKPFDVNASGGATWNYANHKAGIATDGVSLSAAPYVVQSRTVEDVVLSTYFFDRAEGSKGADQSNLKFAKLWLDSAEDTVRRYKPILGAYPHKKFDIVENFFQSGYGMPSYTLLGDRVIRYVSMKAKRSGGKIPPGYLDHEYVHGWFGNGMLVDYEAGNWCEAFTTYYSNYLAQEIDSPEKAKTYRRSVLEKYSLRITPKNDYPIRKFVTKTEDFDNDIGYGKGSMLVHQLRRACDANGNEGRFFKLMQKVTQDNLGKIVRWKDLLGPLLGNGQSSFDPYLDRLDLPIYQLGDVTVQPREGIVWPVYVDMKQITPDDSPFWKGIVDVRFSGMSRSGTRVTADYQIDAQQGVVRRAFRLPFKPDRFELDPDANTLRRIQSNELPACLNATLEANGNGVVYMDGPDEVFGQLAKRFASQKGFRVVEGDFDTEKHNGPVVHLRLADSGKPTTVAGVTLDNPGRSVLVSEHVRGLSPRTYYVAASKQAAARVGYVPFYGWDTKIVFQNGRPMQRETVRASTADTVRDLRSPEVRIKSTVDQLASMLRAAEWASQKERSGGLATKSRKKLHALLRDRLGLPSPFPTLGADGQDPHTFYVSIPQSSSATVTLAAKDDKTITLNDAPSCRAFSFGGRADDSKAMPVGSGEHDVHVVSLETTTIDGLYSDAAAKQKSGAAGAVYVLSDSAWNEVRPWLDTVASLTAESEAELAKPGRDGKPRARPNIPSWILGKRARAKRVDVTSHNLVTLTMPVIAVKKSVWTNTSLNGIALATVVERDTVELQNILGLMHAPNHVGSMPLLVANKDWKQPAWLVMAHYDAAVSENGNSFPAADDNASGVACLVEVARRIASKRPQTTEGDLDRSPSVVFALTDGEERGLLGSRDLVAKLKKRYDIKGVINIDSVGRATSKEVHVIGESVHKELGAKVKESLLAQGLKIGKDIDRFAFPHGSDHWPFHEHGIPSVMVWASDYRVMNTAADTPDKVEAGGIAKVAEAIAKFLAKEVWKVK